MIEYRSMRSEDIPAGLSLCRSAGWNQTAREWELFLEMSPDGCRVATDQIGKVVGTVITIRYQDHFSWIGMVLVDPERQKQGIGLQLLKEALQVLSREASVKLDATPAGREVYLKLGFANELQLSRMYCNSVSAGQLPTSDARPMTHKDLPALLNLDRIIFGADRQLLLQWVQKTGLQYAFVIEEQNQITGYSFGRTGHLFTHIGPVIAQDADGAVQLVAAALRNGLGRPVILDVSNDATAWVKWLSFMEFKELRPLIRMVRGSNAYPGVPKKQFAILGPEFG